MKIVILLLIIISNIYSVVPTDEWKPEDEIDVNQKNKDKKIWANLLAVYDNSRKIARGTLTVMERVSEYAWTAQKYLYAIEKTATRAQVIWENIQEVKEFFVYDKEDKKKPFFKRIKDATGKTIKLVEHVEEGIFQQSDALFYEDIPNYKNVREELNVKREKLFESPQEVLHQLRQLARSFQGYEKKVSKLSQISSADARVYDDLKHNKDAKRFAISQATAIDAIASADQKNMEIDNESIPISLTIKESSENGGNLNTADLTQTALVNERNSYLINLREHDYTHDAIRSASQLLLAKVVTLDRRIAEKTTFINVAEKFSDALIDYNKRQTKTSNP